MADNTTLNPGVGGDTIREVEKAGSKTQVIIIDMGGGGVEDIISKPATQATVAALLAELLLKARLTDTQPVSVASLPLPVGAAEEATLAALLAELLLKAKLTDTQPVSAVSLPLPTGAATEATLALVAKDATLTGGTAKEQIYDPNFAQSAMVDQLRGVRSSQLVRVFGDSFADGIGLGDDAGAFTPFVPTTGTGTGGIVNGALEMRTGSAGAACGAVLQSLKTLTFIAGAVSFGQSGVQFPAAPAAWKIVSRKDGVDTAVTNFNGTANTPDGNFHRYEPFYQGAGSCKFMVDGVLLHSLSGQPSSTRTSTLDFPIRYELLSDGVNVVSRYGMFDLNNGYFFEAVYPAADLIMRVRGSSANRLGPAPDAGGALPALPANAVKETGGNIDLLVDYFSLVQSQILRDVRSELRIANAVIPPNGLNLWDESGPLRDDAFAFLT